MQYFGFDIDNSVKPGEIVIEGAKYTGDVNVIHMIGVAVFAERLKVAMCHESTNLVAHVNEETYYKLGFERGGDVGCILPYDPDFDGKEQRNKEIAEAILFGDCGSSRRMTKEEAIISKSESEGQFYSGRITNDEHKAVEILDQFTKAFCIDASVTDDLVFRCSECPFEDQEGKCRAKVFKHKFAPDYKDFGSMGDL